MSEAISYRNYLIRVEYDECPESPREWDNLGTMYCWHRRYKLGDRHDYASPEDLAASIHPSDIVLPLYLYDHSGITMSTRPFLCPWDSGQVGWIVARADDVRKEYGVKRITKRVREQATSVLRCEVETYDQYLTGQVYGYVIEDEDGELVDSCWGYYGSIDYVMSEAKAVVDARETQAA